MHPYAKSANIFASEAASFDRISLACNKFDEVLISPQEKQELIKALLAINPSYCGRKTTAGLMSFVG